MQLRKTFLFSILEIKIASLTKQKIGVIVLPSPILININALNIISDICYRSFNHRVFRNFLTFSSFLRFHYKICGEYQSNVVLLVCFFYLCFFGISFMFFLIDLC